MSKNIDEARKDDHNGTEVNLKSIELRLTSVREALQRSRFVFLVMTIASSAILFTLWNDRFSRDKDLAFASPSYSTSEITQDRPVPMHVFGRQQLVTEWYKNRIIQIGLLGIRLSVSDLSLIGSFTLVVITIWFYFSQRRENQALVTLLRDVHKGYGGKNGLAVRELVYQGIKHSLVFIRTEVSDEPFSGLEDSPPTNTSTDGKQNSPNADHVTIERKILTDRVFRFLAYLPFWAIVAILIRDASALFMKSPTSGTDARLGMILIGQLKWGSVPEFWNSFYPIFLIIVFDSFAICCAIYTRILCNRSRGFAEGSQKTLKQFEESLKKDKASRSPTLNQMSNVGLN